MLQFLYSDQFCFKVIKMIFSVSVSSSFFLWQSRKLLQILYNQCNTNMGKKNPMYLPQFKIVTVELTAKGLELKILTWNKLIQWAHCLHMTKSRNFDIYLHFKRKMEKQEYQNYRVGSKNFNNIFHSVAVCIKQGVWSQTIIFTFSKGIFKFTWS